MPIDNIEGRTTVTDEIDYDRALTLYFNSFDFNDPAPAVGQRPQPSADASGRTDDHWNLRNDNGWLANVYDNGRVLYGIRGRVGFADADKYVTDWWAAKLPD
jgi:hypothetical protein